MRVSYMACGLACPPRARSFGRSFTPRYGVKITATNQEATSAIATTQKIPPAYSPTEELAKPMGRKPAAVTKRAGQHREGRRGPGEGRRAHAVPALLDLHHHHLDRDDGVVDEKPERDDEGAERDPVQVDAEHRHSHEGDGQHERD